MKADAVWTIFRYRLTRLRGQVLGWGIALALLGLMMVYFYGTIAEEREQFDQLLDAYPKELMAFFGDFESFTTPSGFLGMEFFSYMHLILGIFAVLIGSGLLAGDEESGRLDLIMAHPVSRSALFWGRLSAFVVATGAILFIAWLGLAVPSRWTDISELSVLQLALPFPSMFGVLMFFGMLALLLSLLLPSRRSAAMASGLLLVGDFFLVGLSGIDPGLKSVAKLTPLNYYQGGAAMDDFNAVWVIGLLAVALIFALAAWRRFERRDIRVGGEGAWQRPARRSLARLFHRGAAVQAEMPASEGAAVQR
jgi:ABC-2 type transport system permease protein